MLWFGGGRLRSFDGTTWSLLSQPRGLTSWVHGIIGTPDGDLWVGTRSYGIFRRRHGEWLQYSVEDGLSTNLVQSILRATTSAGINRFDGQTWTAYGSPVDRFIGWTGALRQSADGSIWINSDSDRYETVRYRGATSPPEAEITLSLDDVAESGNTVVSWQGIDPWHGTAPEDLRFTWRLDGGDWSTYTKSTEHVFFSLDSGDHVFEVRARDPDFSADPTPAVARFTVATPVCDRAGFWVSCSSQLYLSGCRLRASSAATADCVRPTGSCASTAPCRRCVSRSPPCARLTIWARCWPTCCVNWKRWMCISTCAP